MTLHIAELSEHIVRADVESAGEVWTPPTRTIGVLNAIAFSDQNLSMGVKEGGEATESAAHQLASIGRLVERSHTHPAVYLVRQILI